MSTAVYLNPLSPAQNACQITDNIFKWMFLIKNSCILILISLKLVLEISIDSMSSLVQVIAGCQTIHWCNYVSPGTVFSCDQAALRTLLSVRPSVHPSVRPSVTPFSLCSHHCIIMKFSGMITMTEVLSMQKVKVRGRRSRSHRTKNHQFWPKFGISGL